MTRNGDRWRVEKRFGKIGDVVTWSRDSGYCLYWVLSLHGTTLQFWVIVHMNIPLWQCIWHGILIFKNKSGCFLSLNHSTWTQQQSHVTLKPAGSSTETFWCRFARLYLRKDSNTLTGLDDGNADSRDKCWWRIALWAMQWLINKYVKFLISDFARNLGVVMLW